MRFRVILIGILLLASGVLASAPPEVAKANDFGYPGNYMANNAIHYLYYYSSLDPSLESDTDWVLDNKYGTHPDITTGEYASWSTTNDVWVMDGNYGNSGWYAASPCYSGATYGGSGTWRWCYPRMIKYNNGYHPHAFNTQAERRHYACHEIGHTLGLFHPYHCMNTSGTSYTVSSHDNAHLNYYG